MAAYRPYAKPNWDFTSGSTSRSDAALNASASSSSSDVVAHSFGLNASKSPQTMDRGGFGKWKEKEGPVKNACLSCRAKKAKCDGAQPVCGQCSKKQLECTYVKSKRGGARKKREVAPPSALQEFLKQLDKLMSVHDPGLKPGVADASEETTNVVRTFSSREEVLGCYYTEVHPFLPVMPPRKWFYEVLPTLASESPFLLAAQTILVLVPHPSDPNPKSANSKRLRSAASAQLGQQTIELVERILSQQSTIECVQALAMLSLWEWGNAGNLSKNRARAGQAVQVAMEMGLHDMDKYQPEGSEGSMIEGEDWRRDMARRTWWSVYSAQLTAAVISGHTPVLGPDDPRIMVHFPACSIQDRAWPNWINTMRHCCRSFALVNSVYYGQTETTAWGSPPDQATAEAKEEMRRKIIDIDREVMEFMKLAEASSVIELVPGGEEEVVRNQQLSARLGLAVTHIHIHRQQAFPEVSLFSKKICGLPQAPDFSNQPPLPMAGGVAISPALANGQVYNETPVYQAMDAGGGTTLGGSHVKSYGVHGSIQIDEPYDFVDEMWQPETYPANLSAPWFTHFGGAASLWQPIEADPVHYPPVSATIVPISPSEGRRDSEPNRRRSSIGSMMSIPGALSGQRREGPHKAWGVDANANAVVTPASDPANMQIFPPGISLARCATAAHTIVRLEVLHRSATIAMWNGPPKWLPFCACGLVTGAYAFLLLALAVHAENTFGTSDESKHDEVDALLTNVKVILAGLEAYGVMWSGIEVMANEVRAALEAATRLPYEVRAQIDSNQGSPPDGIQ